MTAMIRNALLVVVAAAGGAHAAPAENLGAVPLPASSHGSDTLTPSTRWYGNATGKFWIEWPDGDPKETTFTLAGDRVAHRVELRLHPDEIYVVMWNPIAHGSAAATAALDAAVASAIAQGKQVGDVEKLAVDGSTDRPGRRLGVHAPDGRTFAFDFAVANDTIYAFEIDRSALVAQALPEKPKLAGALNVLFAIEPNGKVAHAAATGLDPGVEACVAGVVAGIEFPKPSAGEIQAGFVMTVQPVAH